MDEGDLQIRVSDDLCSAYEDLHIYGVRNKTLLRFATVADAVDTVSGRWIANG